MSFSKLGAVKFIVSGIVGIGTGKVVNGIIKEQVKPENLFDKIAVAAASAVISAMATKATKSASDEMIDDVVKAVKEVKEKIKTEAKLGRINNGASTFTDEGLDAENFVKNDKDKWVARKEPLTTDA